MKLNDFSQKYVGDVLKPKYENRSFHVAAATAFLGSASLKTAENEKESLVSFQNVLVSNFNRNVLVSEVQIQNCQIPAQSGQCSDQN